MAAAQAEEAEVQYEEEEEQGGGGSTLITEVSEGRWQSALLENVFLFYPSLFSFSASAAVLLIASLFSCSLEYAEAHTIPIAKVDIGVSARKVSLAAREHVFPPSPLLEKKINLNPQPPLRGALSIGLLCKLALLPLVRFNCNQTCKVSVAANRLHWRILSHPSLSFSY